jgi:hypothetical protein
MQLPPFNPPPKKEDYWYSFLLEVFTAGPLWLEGVGQFQMQLHWKLNL